MIGWISGWAQGIIVAVMIATIIEMILPEGSCKKYIKVVIGVYILFTIVSPVITKFTGKTIAVSDVLELDQYIDEIKEKEKAQNLLQEENATSIRDIYIGNLKADMKNKLKGKGYVVTYIEVDVGYDDNYTLKKVTMSVEKEVENEASDDNENMLSNEINKVETINSVSISITNEEDAKENVTEKEEQNHLNNSDKNKIKEYLSGIYEIKEKNIIIN